ncbi:MAG: YihA family ribosome biogenesis GTP-binding protein [Rhodospirillaceae bacterium]|nr:YihA family ribosome biogenesis GTP-binding protein [Rhodospirillaceae bacterium]
MTTAPQAAAFDPAVIAAGQHLFTRPVAFVTGALAEEYLPAGKLPEVAFAGRSNVGKSSLINALVGQRQLARASGTPGRTQEINFFNLGERLMLVDLPGYGFAQAPRDKAEVWSLFIRRYLKGRPQLRRALILIDARHGVKTLDEDIMTMMDESAMNYQVVLTKTDKIKPAELAATQARVAETAAKHTAAHPLILATSAAEGNGLPELRAALSELALPE